MPSRRALLASFAGGAAAGGLGVAALPETGYGSIEWANERDTEVRVRTLVRSRGGFLSEPATVYESTYRVFPTEHTRGGDTNVVETGTYEVAVTVDTEDETVGPFGTVWRPAGCHHQRLIVRVTTDLEVEFVQREC